MRNRLTIFIFICIVCQGLTHNIFAQDKIYKPFKYAFRASIGPAIPLSGPADELITNALFYNQHQIKSSMTFSGIYFISDWGLEASLVMMGNSQNDSDIRSKIKADYPNYYYSSNKQFQGGGSVYWKILLGPVYRRERKNWILIRAPAGRHCQYYNTLPAC